MSVLESVVDDLKNALRKFLPGLTVVLGVMLLLRGVSGSVQAIKLQMVTLATSFLGAGEGMIGVLLHTLPLAIAAAVATFAIARRMIRFESQLSILTLALIVITGASVGGFLRQFAPKPAPKPRPSLAAVATLAPPPEIASKAKGIPIGIGTLDAPRGLATIASQPAATNRPLQPESALEQLRRIDWLAQPDLSSGPPQQIAPLALIPQLSGIPGIAAKAINQLLGYLVAYQPRLFLAAILAGGWVGWSWHRRLEKLTQYADDCRDRDDREAPKLRRAA